MACGHYVRRRFLDTSKDHPHFSKRELVRPGQVSSPLKLVWLPNDSSLMPNLYLLRENFDCPVRLRQLSSKTGQVDEPRSIEISAVVG